jgi:biopolymer transport protein ExbD
LVTKSFSFVLKSAREATVSKKRKKEPGIDVTLPITPMLDMSFQLLSFFILTFRPMAQEGQMAMNLPKLDVTNTQPQDDIIPPSDEKAEYTVSIRSELGNIGLLSFKGPTESPVDFSGAGKIESLKSKLKAIADKDHSNVTIESDSNLVYAALIEVMDACRKEGFESISLKPIKGETP